MDTNLTAGSWGLWPFMAPLCHMGYPLHSIHIQYVIASRVLASRVLASHVLASHVLASCVLACHHANSEVSTGAWGFRETHDTNAGESTDELHHAL